MDIADKQAWMSELIVEIRELLAGESNVSRYLLVKMSQS